ncbi:hypothetical protein F5Y04DRAFT_291582 [Hypomontagnella monticulosa]|nr:hypothetical protein F5Y04DRAFT_291582 [Hypomontagnella monticulosa]
MSTCSWGDTPTNTSTPMAPTPAPLAQRTIPKGTVSSRISRLHRLTHSHHGIPEDHAYAARERKYVLVGGRNAHNQEHGFTTGSSYLSDYLPRSASSRQQIRQNRSRGSVGKPKRDISSSVANPYALSALDNFNTGQPSSRSPLTVNPLKITKSDSVGSSRPRASKASGVSSPATVAKQRESARSLYEQHGIRRPSGWFSDEEDLSLSGDRTAGPRRFCRICHVCSARTWSQTHCPACKHRLCAKCVCEVPEGTERAHTSFLHHQGHAMRSGEARLAKPTSATAATRPSAGRPGPSRVSSALPAKQRPQIVINDEPVETTVRSPSIAPSVIRKSQDRKSSQWYTGDSDLEISSTKVECDNPMCRATHDGHYPYRHSITCALDRSEEAEKARVSPDNAFTAHLPNPLTTWGISRYADESTHKRHTQNPDEPSSCACSCHTKEAVPSDRSHHHGHHQAVKHPRSAGQEEISHKNQGKSDEANTTLSQNRELQSRESRHHHETTSHHTTHRSEATSKAISPATGRGTRKDSDSRKPIPKGRVFSPPLWLKAPSKEAGDAKSGLRHVDAKSHGQAHRLQKTSARGDYSKSPRDLSHSPKFASESSNNLSSPSHDFLRSSAPSPPTALHVTQHQRPEYLLNHPSKHVHPEERLHHMIGSASNSPHESLIAVNHQTTPGHKHLGPYLRVEDARPSRSGSSSSLSAQSGAHSSQKTLKGSRYADHNVLEHSWDKTDRSEAGSSSGRTDTHTIREAGYRQSSALSRTSHSPPQPRHIVTETDESTVSERNTSASETNDRSYPRTPDLEIHRPSPIAPPNHDCIWKDRYMAVTAEIRMLKAELSTRASLRGTDIEQIAVQGEETTTNEDEDLGLQGVTIIMHLRGRDDLVINTDLTQDE